jgi:hypothetical protein
MNKRKVRPYRYYKNKLQQTLKFTDEDLEANRHGEITDAQAAVLKIQALKDSAICFLPLAFIFLEGVWGFAVSPGIHAKLLFFSHFYIPCDISCRHCYDDSSVANLR